MAGETSKAPLLVRRAVSNELANQEKQAKRKYVGRCALLDACRNNQPDIVRFLLQTSVSDTDQRESVEYMALYEACDKGYTGIVNDLLQSGFDINVCDRDGISPLVKATAKGHIETVQALLKQKDIDINIKDPNGVTALHIAVSNNCSDIVTCMLQHGADIEAVDNEFNTSLHIAAKIGQFEVLKILLTKGAKVNALNGIQCTSLHLAARQGHTNIVHALLIDGAATEIQQKAGATALILACMFNQLYVVKLLCESGSNIHACTHRGSTGLHKAAEKGNLDIVKYLLSRNANILLKNKEGNTPSVVAKQNGHHDIAHEIENYIGIPEYEVCPPSNRIGGSDIDSNQYITALSSTNVEFKEDETKESSEDNGCGHKDEEEYLRLNSKNKTVGKNGGLLDNLPDISMLDKQLEAVFSQINNCNAEVVPVDNHDNQNINDERTKAFDTKGLDLGRLWREINNIGKEIHTVSMKRKVKAPIGKDLNDKHLLHIAIKLGQDWKLLAGVLAKMDLSEIRQVEAKYKGESCYAGWNLLEAWRDEHSGKDESMEKKIKQLKVIFAEINRKDLWEFL